MARTFSGLTKGFSPEERADRGEQGVLESALGAGRTTTLSENSGRGAISLLQRAALDPPPMIQYSPPRHTISIRHSRRRRAKRGRDCRRLRRHASPGGNSGDRA